jgi:hypothetical protein
MVLALSCPSHSFCDLTAPLGAQMGVGLFPAVVAFLYFHAHYEPQWIILRPCPL